MIKYTRFRINDGRKPSGYQYDWTDGNRPPPNAGHEDRCNIGAFAGEYRVCWDNNNVGARKAIAHGDVILSDCLMVRITRTSKSGSISAVNNVFPNSYYGTQVGDLCGSSAGVPLNPSPDEISTGSENLMLVKAYAKLHESTIMGGEALATLGQTVAMLRSPFKSATQLLGKMAKYRALRLGKTATSAAKATADTWLEHRYGWKPLIMDANAIIRQAQIDRAKVQKLRLIIRAGTKGESSTSQSWSPTTAGNRSGSETIATKLSCNAGVLFDLIDQSAGQRLLGTLGLRPRDIIPTVWELIPYSFVADWFVNIGDWLQAITPVPGITVRGHWVTSCIETAVSTVDSIAFMYPSQHVTDWQGPLGSNVITTSKFQRICNQPLSFTPTLTAKPLSMLHQADAMALLLQPILGGLKSFRH